MFFKLKNKSSHCYLLISIATLLVFSDRVFSQVTALAPVPNILIDVRPQQEKFLYSVTKIASIDKNPYLFELSMDMPGGLPFNGDLYLGVIGPQNTAYSWFVNRGKVVLKEGLFPIIENIDLTVNGNFNLSTEIGKTIEYEFTGKEKSGMYMIVGLLVEENSNPYNTKNWITYNMSPLFFMSSLFF